MEPTDPQYHIDQFTPRAVCGWAFSRQSASVRVQIWAGGRCLAETVADAVRSDVAQAHPDAPSSLKSGFGIDFALPENGTFVEVSVRLLFQDKTGQTMNSIEVARQKFVSAEGRRAMETRPDNARFSPFPRDVAKIAAALWPEAPVESYQEEEQLAVADLILQVAAQPAAEEFAPLAAYARYLRETWSHFEFVRRYFPRTNERRACTDKDYCCTPNSPEELFLIAHHLYVARSHGLEGSFAEFGCYQGYSTAMLSYACRLLGLRMHVFDSFAGLPASNSPGYAKGEFAGALPEVRKHVERYGAPEVVTYHEGFFAETLGAFVMPPLISLWMDVDLESSADDVMKVFGSIDRRGAIFSHECESRDFTGDCVVMSCQPHVVAPAIAHAFARAGAPVRGRFLRGNTGAFWRRDEGIPVLGATPLRKLIEGL